MSPKAADRTGIEGSLAKSGSVTLPPVALMVPLFRTWSAASTMLPFTVFDADGKAIGTMLRKAGVEVSFHADPSIRTTQKLRVIGGRQHQLLHPFAEGQWRGDRLIGAGNRRARPAFDVPPDAR